MTKLFSCVKLLSLLGHCPVSAWIPEPLLDNYSIISPGVWPMYLYVHV